MAGKPPIWTEPLELVCDGTPVVINGPGYHCDDERELVREDGLSFTDEQHPAGIKRYLTVTAEGKQWQHCGPNSPVVVRNRVEVDPEDSVDDRPLNTNSVVHREGDDHVTQPAAEPRETLRDRFAMAALTAIIIRGMWSISTIATDAYEVADAMMAERDKGGVA